MKCHQQQYDNTFRRGGGLSAYRETDDDSYFERNIGVIIKIQAWYKGYIERKYLGMLRQK